MGALVRIELALMLRNRGLIVLALATLVLLALATSSGTARVATLRTTHAGLQAEDEARTSKLAAELDGIERGTMQPGRFSDPRNVGRVGRDLATRHAILPIAPLAALANGDADLRPSHYLISSRHFSSFAGEYELRSPLSLATGALDVSFVIGVALPLLLIAIGAPLFVPAALPAIERLLLASPGAAARRFSARWLAVVATIMAITIVVVAVSMLLVRGTQAQPGDWSAFAALVLGYLAIWSAIVALVSTWSRRVTTALAAGLCVWAVATFIGPAALGTLTDRMHPIPSRVGLLVAEREAQLDSERKHSSLLAKYLHDHPEAAAPGEKVDIPDWLMRFYIQQSEIDAMAAPERERIAAIKAKRHEVFAHGQWLLPGLAFESALQRLAGTHPSRYAAFESSVARFHAQWQEYFLPRVLAGTKFLPQDVKTIPSYAASDHRVQARQTVQATALAFIGGAALLWLLVAWRTLRLARAAPPARLAS